MPTLGCLESTLSPLPLLVPEWDCIATGTEDRETALMSRSSAVRMCKTIFLVRHTILARMQIVRLQRVKFSADLERHVNILVIRLSQ